VLVHLAPEGPDPEALAGHALQSMEGGDGRGR
jgi:hypothetical protein